MLHQRKRLCFFAGLQFFIEIIEPQNHYAELPAAIDLISNCLKQLGSRRFAQSMPINSFRHPFAEFVDTASSYSTIFPIPHKAAVPAEPLQGLAINHLAHP